VKHYHVEFRIESRFEPDDLLDLILNAVEDFGEVYGPHTAEVMPWTSR
jgi:hypothetical protein